MNLEETKIKGAYFIEHKSYDDERGSFYELIEKNLLQNLNCPDIDKVNISVSKYGVLRGLHYQIQAPQVKFVSCLKGQVIDFAVDIREQSPTFGEVIQYELSEKRSETLYLPKGVAHGFISLSEISMLLYLVSGTYHKKLERGINYKSVTLDLPIEPILVNSRDNHWPNFDQAEYYKDK